MTRNVKTEEQEMLVRKAIMLLNSVGAQFHVQFNKQDHFSNIPLPSRKRVYRTDLPKNGQYIRGFIDEMKEGDVKVIPMQDGDEFRRFAGTLSANCHNLWTPKGYTGKGIGIYYGIDRDPETKQCIVYRFK